ncbi:MAG: hypothetical protein KDK70_20500 [Myxococcales bacterium]|nr:hypothetical protein [Myxococcales bacterium]
MLHRLPPAVALALSLLPACDSTQSATQTAKEASDKALEASKEKASELASDAKALGKDAAEATKEAAGKAVDASKEAMGDVADATREGVHSLYEDLRTDGELSQTAKAWLAAQAEKASEADIEAIVHTGVQLAPVALEASKVLADAVDTETAIEPIFQRVGDDQAKIDEAIGDMPRVEAIEGLTVGFKQLDTLDSSTSVKQRGYLVMWRHEEHLVGFVYRSTRTIDLDKLVAETPRLVKLTQQALDD